MGKVIVVTSGKGGVGKTTSTAALGAALARGGQRVVAVDFDVGLRNLDLVMGAERRVVFDLTNVVQGTATLSEALLSDERLDTLYLLPASRTRGKEALTEDAVIVVNPEISSVRDSSRILGLVDAKPLKVETGGRLDKHLLITRFNPARVACGEMLSVDDIREVLPIPLLGIIPESEEVLRASNLGAPITVCGRESAVSRAYVDAARRIKGDWIEMTVPAKDKSRFTKWLGGRAA